MDSDIHLVIIIAGRSWKLCIRVIGWRVHKLPGDEWCQEVDTSVGCYQGGDGRCNHTVSEDGGLRIEGGQAPDLCVIRFMVQGPNDVPDELPGVGFESLIWGILVVLGGRCPLYYGFQFWSLLCW